MLVGRARAAGAGIAPPARAGRRSRRARPCLERHRYSSREQPRALGRACSGSRAGTRALPARGRAADRAVLPPVRARFWVRFLPGRRWNVSTGFFPSRRTTSRCSTAPSCWPCSTASTRRCRSHARPTPACASSTAAASANARLAEIASLQDDHDAAVAHLRELCEWLDEQGLLGYLSTLRVLLWDESCASSAATRRRKLSLAVATNWRKKPM